MKYILFFTLFFTFLISTLYSQDLTLPKNIQSPNAASLGEYGDIGVSYYTGSPNIQVPLYNISDYGIPLDISLKYNSKGVRVNSMPSWVGQNWSLQVGGVITRMVKGRVPDEWFVPSHSAALGNFYGYIHPESRNLVNVPNWNSSSNIWYLYEQMRAINNSNYNREYHPDIFTFNFMGYSGKFFLGSDGEWKVSSDFNIEIIIDQNDNQYPFGHDRTPFNEVYNIPNQDYPTSKQIYKIILKDDDGISYVFGNTDSSIEYGVPFYNQNPGRWHANSWYLTEVRDRFNKQIYVFEYDREDYIASFYKYRSHRVFNAVDSGSSGFDQSCYYSGGNHFSYEGELISPVYLKKIVTSDGDIDFNRQTSYGRNYTDDPDVFRLIRGVMMSNGQNQFINPSNMDFYPYLMPYSDYPDILSDIENWRKLTSISGLEKTVNFSYNDLTPDSSINDRLNLEKVIIDNMAYEFEYDNFSALPNYLSTSVDHWGYYDGSPWVVSYNNFNSHFNSRNTHSANVKKGMLAKMIYPTKGFTEFEWEANRYFKYLSDNKSNLVNATNSLAGGVRIKNIKNHNGNGYENLREFKYVKNYHLNTNSSLYSGILENLPKHYWSGYPILSFNEPSYYLYENIFNTNPILPTSNYMGYHIGYSEVVEVFDDGSFNIYKYTANDEAQYRDEFMVYPQNPQPSPYTSYNDKSMLRGKLKEFTSFNSTRNPVRKTINTYNLSNTNFAKGINIKSAGCLSGANLGVGFLKVDLEKIYYFDQNKTKERNISFENNNQLETYTEFNYEDYPNTPSTLGDQFLKSKKTNVYANENSQYEQFYQEDYDYVFDKPESTYNNLVSQNKMALIQTNVLKNNTLLSSSKTEYESINGNILPKKQFYSKNDLNSFEETVIIDDYNANQLVVRSHVPDGSHSYYAYDGEYLIFKVEGPYQSNFNYLNSRLSSIINGGLTLEEKIVKQKEVINQYTNHFITAYNYKPNVGVTSITDPKGYTTYFEYDSYERLVRIKNNDGNIVEQNIYNLKSN